MSLHNKLEYSMYLIILYHYFLHDLNVKAWSKKKTKSDKVQIHVICKYRDIQTVHYMYRYVNHNRDLHCWDSDTPDFVGGGQLLPEGVRPVDKAHWYRSYNNQYIKSLYWGTKLTDIVATTTST